MNRKIKSFSIIVIWFLTFWLATLGVIAMLVWGGMK